MSSFPKSPKFEFEYIIEGLEEGNAEQKLIPYLNQLAQHLLNNQCCDAKIRTIITIDSTRKTAKVNIGLK